LQFKQFWKKISLLKTKDQGEFYMRVTDLYKTKKPVISMEFFSPRKPAGADQFSKTVDTLSALHPDYFSVTFGAGGSKRERSYQAVGELICI